MKIKPSAKEKEIEKAIMMLVDCVREKCLNPKSLILHSIRVGLRLQELNQTKEVVIAGILHDLVEDTNCTVSQIEKEFGRKTAKLVSALSQEKIADYKERWRILIKKITQAGKGAMLIKIIDVNDNLIHYLPLVTDQEARKTTLWKAKFTLKSLKPFIGNLKAFKELETTVKRFR